MKTEKTDLEAWPEMLPYDRNWLIGVLLSAEPMFQYKLMVNGKEFSQLLPRTLEECESIAAYARGAGWGEFADQNCFPDAWRNTVAVQKDKWHCRYCNTPGGGWMVIEHLRKLGASIQIQSTAAGWRVIAYTTGRETIEQHEETMEEAACVVLLKFLDGKESA